MGSKRQSPSAEKAIDACAQIFDTEMPVNPNRRFNIFVAQDALHAVRVDAVAQKKRRGRVAKIVEAKRPRESARPELHFAHGVIAQRIVRVPLDMRRSAVRAAAANVIVAVDDASACERMAEHSMRRCLQRTPLPARSREDQVAARFIHRVKQEGLQHARDRNHVRMPALGRISIVRALNDEHTVRDIDVGFLQREQLALAHARKQRGREQVAPVVRHMGEK